MGGGSDVYNSPFDPQTDSYIQSLMSGMLTGKSVSPDPNMIGSNAAQRVGGSYANGIITTPDGSKYTVQPDGSITQTGNNYGGPEGWKNTRRPGRNGGLPTGFKSQGEYQTYLNSGGKVVDASGNPIDLTQKTGKYDEVIQQSAADTKATMEDPNSPWNTMATSFQQKYYDPNTGQFSDSSFNPDNVTTKDQYFQDYGGYLDKEYAPTDYQEQSYNKTSPYTQSSYQDFNYQSPTVNTVAPVIDSAWDTIYNQRAKDTEARSRDSRADAQDFTARQGSSLSSGRKAALDKDIGRETQSTLDSTRADVEAQKAMQKYGEAQNVRDKQLNYDWDTQMKKADQNQYGQTYNQGEARYGYEAGDTQNKRAEDTRLSENRYGQDQALAEKQYGFTDSQARGREKMTTAEAMDTQQYNKAQQERRVQQQNTLNAINVAKDMLALYNNQDQTGVATDAAEANAIASAMGGITSAFGGVGSALAGKK